MTARHATGGVPLLGAAAAAPPPMAAFLTGLAGTAAELDEGNYPAGGHPAIHAIAPALAEAAARDCTGEALLTACIAGYEAGSRVGNAMRLRAAAHPHGTWGVIGAAAAVASLRGHDAAADPARARPRRQPRPRHQRHRLAPRRLRPQRLRRRRGAERPARSGSG